MYFILYAQQAQLTFFLNLVLQMSCSRGHFEDVLLYMYRILHIDTTIV